MEQEKPSVAHPFTVLPFDSSINKLTCNPIHKFTDGQQADVILCNSQYPKSEEAPGQVVIRKPRFTTAAEFSAFSVAAEVQRPLRSNCRHAVVGSSIGVTTDGLDVSAFLEPLFTAEAQNDLQYVSAAMTEVLSRCDLLYDLVAWTEFNLHAGHRHGWICADLDSKLSNKYLDVSNCRISYRDVFGLAFAAVPSTASQSDLLPLVYPLHVTSAIGCAPEVSQGVLASSTALFHIAARVFHTYTGCFEELEKIVSALYDTRLPVSFFTVYGFPDDVASFLSEYLVWSPAARASVAPWAQGSSAACERAGTDLFFTCMALRSAYTRLNGASHDSRAVAESVSRSQIRKQVLQSTSAGDVSDLTNFSSYEEPSKEEHSAERETRISAFIGSAFYQSLGDLKIKGAILRLVACSRRPLTREKAARLANLELLFFQNLGPRSVSIVKSNGPSSDLNGLEAFGVLQWQQDRSKAEVIIPRKFTADSIDAPSPTVVSIMEAKYNNQVFVYGDMDVHPQADITPGRLSRGDSSTDEKTVDALEKFAHKMSGDADMARADKGQDVTPASSNPKKRPWTPDASDLIEPAAKKPKLTSPHGSILEYLLRTGDGETRSGQLRALMDFYEDEETFAEAAGSAIYDFIVARLTITANDGTRMIEVAAVESAQAALQANVPSTRSQKLTVEQVFSALDCYEALKLCLADFFRRKAVVLGAGITQSADNIAPDNIKMRAPIRNFYKILLSQSFVLMATQKTDS